jgi:hypothetical protein
VRKILKRTLLGACALFLGLQIWPAGRTNPPTTAGLDADPAVTSILRRACFDCHSNETRWPWYAYVAPVSCWMVEDVDHGRSELNFSEWGSYSEEKRRKRAARALDEVEEGHMPIPKYLRMHPEARLSPAEVEILRAWVETQG